MDAATPERIGPYRVTGQLGGGGMGVVYRAEPVDGGEPVALKTVRAVSPGLVQRLRIEIQALAGLVHPGVVRIADHGLEGGIPWYAMELVPGAPLSARMRPRAADTSLSVPGRDETWTSTMSDLADADGFVPGVGGPGLERAVGLRIVRRLCGTLAWLHGEGVVHRDLKPDNIVVRPDEAPILVDFGLLGRFAGADGRERLDVETAPAGTLSYIAPEQIRGELVDARADLYALGCILFELVTGEPPFSGVTARRVLTAHLEEPPRRMSELVGGVPPGLDDLVQRLLAKDPGARLGYADAVGAALGALGVAHEGLQGPPPRAYLYRPPLAGRAAVMAELRERLHAQGGGVILLVGESGSGKTRVAGELGREATKRGHLVVTGECWRGCGGLEGVRGALQAIADRCRSRGEPETTRLLGRGGGWLARYEPALVGVPGSEAWPEPGELPPALAQRMLFGHVEAAVRALADGHPALVVVDDLQWADELTLGLLDHAARSGTRALWLATCRADEPHAAIEALRGVPGVATVEVGALEDGDVAEMIGEMLALRPAPEAFSRWLRGQAEGNPFFVAEYLKTAVAEGLLWRDDAGHWEVATPEGAAGQDFQALPLPRSVRDLVALRLVDLPESAARVLAAAAVAGREADPGLVAEVLGWAPDRVAEARAELRRRQIVEEGRDALRFAHAGVRDVALDGIAPSTVSDLHGRVAEALERRGEGADTLGEHWEAAGDRDRARAAWLATARADRARYALGRARRMYEGALRVTGPGAERGAIQSELAQVLVVSGQVEGALAAVEAGLADAVASGDLPLRSRLLGQQSALLRTAGHTIPARIAGLEALRLAEELRDPRLVAQSTNALAVVEHVQGRFPEARALYVRSLDQARVSDDSVIESRSLGNLAVLEHDEGNLSEARRLYEEGVALARKLRDRVAEGKNLGNLGSLLDDIGDRDGSRARYEQALAIAKEVGDAHSEARTQGNLGALLVRSGRFAEAVDPLEQALAASRARGDRANEAYVSAVLAMARFELGDLAGGRAAIGEATAIAEALGDRRHQGLFRVLRATYERRRGTLVDVAVLDEARAVLVEMGVRSPIVLEICERGHRALMEGRSARPQLAEVAALAEGQTLDLQARTAMSGLQRAQEAWESGVPLRYGDVEERLSTPPSGV